MANKRETRPQRKSWLKPEHRRMDMGSARGGQVNSADGGCASS